MTNQPSNFATALTFDADFEVNAVPIHSIYTMHQATIEC
jgi:hypothetical protein